MVLVRGNRAQASLDRWKTWWLANNNAMTAIVCLLTGLWALARGLAGAA
jgi:DMSO reductase anchor subunit